VKCCAVYALSGVVWILYDVMPRNTCMLEIAVLLYWLPLSPRDSLDVVAVCCHLYAIDTENERASSCPPKVASKKM